MSDTPTIANARRRRALELALARVLDTGDVAAVHDARVAAGRLSVWVELSGRRAPRDDLRSLRRALTRVRDLDVELETGVAAEVEAWRARVGLERVAALSAARTALDGARVAPVIEALRVLPDLDRRAAEAPLGRLARRARRAGDAVADLGAGSDPDGEARHRARRRIRRLRYALEWLGHDASGVRAVQDAFGLWNDTRVELEAWLAGAAPAGVAPAVRARVERNVRAHLVARERALRDAWTVHRAAFVAWERGGAR